MEQGEFGNFKFDLKKIDIDKTIDFSNKNIICFGAGTAAKILLDTLPDNITVSYFTDNNSKLWGSDIEGISIISPKEIENIKDALIIIISRHVVSIKKQLNEMGFEENKNYIDLYSGNIELFRFSKQLDIIYNYDKFLDDIPRDYFEKISLKSNEKIGIVVFDEIPTQKICFQITLYLLLKSFGYNVKIFVDIVENFTDYKSFDGVRDFSVKAINHFLEILNEEFGLDDFEYLKGDQKLSSVHIEEDGMFIQANTRDTVKSIIAYMGDLKKESDIDREKLSIQTKNKIENHYRILKSFMSNTDYDVLVVPNGTVAQRANYSYLGHKKNIRIPSYDTWFWSTDLPACWLCDLKNIDKYFSKEELKYLADQGYKMFEDRMYNNSGDEGFVQIVEYNKKEEYEKFDVLIPLNVMFDSATFGVDKVFNTPEEWLYKTVKFLKENTSARVIIKESPVGKITESLNYLSEYDLISEFIDDNRIIYYDRESKKNIYRLIENCKVVLPYSSTIGIEAALLNKCVITHTKCFYSEESFVKCVNSEQEYFETITDQIQSNKKEICNLDKAAELFFFIHSDIAHNKSSFNEVNIDWIKSNFKDLRRTDYVESMVNVISKNKPWYFNKIIDNKYDERMNMIIKNKRYLPKRIMLEVSSLCNHRCVFCFKKDTKKNMQVMSNEVATRMIKEGYELGAREISFHGMGEPLLCKELKEYVKLAKEIGYTYAYLDTNGALAIPDVINPIIDNGLDSIKFSVSASNQKDYKIVHGRDDFEKAVNNIKQLSEYRNVSGKKFKIYVDYVETVYTKGQYNELCNLLKDYVDEIWFSDCLNQGGIMSQADINKLQVKSIECSEVCKEPFDRIVITADGKVSGCCMYDDSETLFYGDVNENSLKTEWENKKHYELCKTHITGEGINKYCQRCELKKIYQVKGRE